MKRHRSVHRLIVAALLLLAFLVQGTWALAGTTGGLSGTITDNGGMPVSGATVTVTSPSQQSKSTSDAAGHYNFLALAPDTYSVQVEKTGYQPEKAIGVSIFADNNMNTDFKLLKITEIAHVTSRAAASLVHSGITTDTYSVDSATIVKANALGGGGNLDNAYSAIASVPGVTVPVGGIGWNQAVYIRGSQSFFSGFEYDGIPVNRAFDNYNSSTESNLGLQELQVYTGGGPSSNASSGTAGFINQVIKTGTYPGSGTMNFSLATPAFYHQAKVEAGGATPDHNFSYYIGMNGYNQQYRNFDQSNGAGLFVPNGTYGFAGAFFTNANLSRTNGHGVLPLCNAADGTAPASVENLPWFAAEGRGSCLYDDPAAALFNTVTGITDRENVANFHFRIGHKNGMKDDVQLLASSSALTTTFFSSTNDGGGPGPFTLAVTGSPYCSPSLRDANGQPCAAPNFPQYQDAVVYNLPFGAPIAGAKPINYYQPSSNPNRAFGAELPANLRDTIQNDTGVFKLQYTHPLSDKAFIRAYGYSFFSDWTQAGAQGSYNNYLWGIGGPTDGTVAANYDLITHTTGGELQFADQLSAKHLFQLTGNYTQAQVTRFNNSGFALLGPGTGSPIGYISQSGGGFQCWDPANPNTAIPCLPGGAYQSDAVTGPTGTAPAGSAAATAGAQWVSLWNGAAKGSLNHVQPQFSSIAATDEWRASDKLLFNLGLRGERYKYVLENSVTPQTSFYASLISQFVCQNGVGQIDTIPLRPGQAPPAKINYEATCPAGYSHPNFSVASPPSYTISDIAPRLSFTYTQNPDTVWRGSIGRYTEPPISASVQYLNSSGNNLSVWGATLPLGFNSPFHPIPAMSATQADLSFERRIRGTDMSFKISPFFNYTNGYQEQSFIGPNFVTQAPVGAFRSRGVEFAFSKGDFRRQGLSGMAALTYTDAKVQYQDRYYGANQIRVANSTITAFNKLTKGGGGSPCYKQSTDPTNANRGIGDPVSCSYSSGGFGAITNPYYNTAAQPLLNESGWYAPGNTGLDPSSNPATAYFDSPWVGSLILNYRHDKFAITPSLQIQQGSSYGGPLDVAGIDPRACKHNISQAPGNIAAADPGSDPNQCDYLALSGSSVSGASSQLFIPNPQNGNTFAMPGQFRSPWLAVGNIAMSYELTPKVTANLTLANVFHNCFGGSSAPWTSAYAPGRNICGYAPAGASYISNYYNGKSPNDAVANGVTPYPWQLQSYLPSAGSGTTTDPLPFTAYFSVQFRI